MPNLTRAEATERARLISVDRYSITLDLTPPNNGAGFRCETSINFACTEPGASTFLDLRADAIESMSLNGTTVEPAIAEAGRLTLTGLATYNTLTVVARMPFSNDGEGMHRHVDPADGNTYLFAMSFLDSAPRWYACFDQPDLKARYDIAVTCPPDWIVLGNGQAQRLAPGFWRLAETEPIATYLSTLVAGPYRSIVIDHGGIRLGFHARATLGDLLDAQKDELLSVTATALERLQELFGTRYPFGAYHQAFVPGLNVIAMENPGCVLFRDQLIFDSASTTAQRAQRAITIVHEMAHMWFGNLVTMRWWDDLWLNESFAEYTGRRVAAELTSYPSWELFGIEQKDAGFLADQGPSSHPIAGNGAEDALSAQTNFDGISYAKGATALKQLARHLGDAVFFGGLRRHFTSHAFGNADLADLLRSWELAGANDIGEWAQQWLTTKGIDRLSSSRREGRLTLKCQSPDHARRVHNVRVVGLDDDGSERWANHVTIDVGEQDLKPVVPVRLIVPDGDDDTWATTRFGDTSWQVAAEILPKVRNAATRVVIYNAVRDAVRNGELAPQSALAIILVAVANEPAAYLTQSVLSFALSDLAGTYSPTPARVTRRAAIACVASSLLLTRTSGSDLQLELVRAYIAACDDPVRLLALLEGRESYPGLLIDEELRWLLIERLAAVGSFDTIRIDHEFTRHPTTSATVHAARARALVPTVQAKEAAWRQLTEPTNTSAQELYATAEAFFSPMQEPLVAEWTFRYFSEMPSTAPHRTGTVLARIATLAYPVCATDPRTLESADRLLATERNFDPRLRRSFIDGTDLLRRAFRSRANFANE